MASSFQHRQLGPYSRSAPGRVLNGFGTARTLVLGLARILFSALPVATASAAPTSTLDALTRRKLGWFREHSHTDDPDAGASNLVLYAASVTLVLLGGAFAGLTIALMGQDSIYLQVVSRDDAEPQQKNAKRVYDLLQRGKHWVLVTLLLSNVIVNETLPVVLDRCLGGGVAAVVGSTLLIVIFGEILPQSICVRYGLQIGGIMAKPVLVLMWLLAPIAWPTAKLLDRALGEDHGTVYKKSGLKTLVTLHRSLGEMSERLNQDEVTIISAVLDLKEKPVSSVMTPMEDVFTMSEDTILDEKMMDMILSAGYSRIPIHEPFNPTNFVGMLLVKILITYDPDDKMRVSEFPLATLPETRPETSCLDIVNFFQEGKSHMVLVSQYPGEDHGALGVVTLEDVIEELIGEEIIDESDVYIDVHKAIRRLQPAPRARPMRHRSLASENGATATTEFTEVATEAEDGEPSMQQETMPIVNALAKSDRAPSSSPKMTTVMMRRYSAGANGRMTRSTVPVRANIDEMWQHLRHLGPSNPATNPKNTRLATVKIKTGPRASTDSGVPDDIPAELVDIGEPIDEDDSDAEETTRLLAPKAADGHEGNRSSQHSHSSLSGDTALALGTDVKIPGHENEVPANPLDAPAAAVADVSRSGSVRSRDSGRPILPAKLSRVGSYASGDADGGRNVAAAENVLQSGSESSSPNRPSTLLTSFRVDTEVSRRPLVRSGSITENVIETRGIRKVVLETTSSTEEDEDTGATKSASPSLRRQPLSAHVWDAEGKPASPSSASSSSRRGDTPLDSGAASAAGGSDAPKKKNRRKKRKPAK